MRPPSRSAVPLAAVGIICLGLVPTLGGPDLPLHWAVTAGITGFGVLLALRHRLRRQHAPLAPVLEADARLAGRAVLSITVIVGLLVLGIVVRQLSSSGPIRPFSLALPVLGLVWLASLGIKALRFRSPQPDDAAPTDRASRRPGWERLTPSGSSPPGDPGRHANV